MNDDTTSAPVHKAMKHRGAACNGEGPTSDTWSGVTCPDCRAMNGHRGYRIVRAYQGRDRKARTIRRGLTLFEAQEHCSDPETSSRTATRSRVRGSWFDCYERD